jgi:AcrR family transcriptional regulator
MSALDWLDFGLETLAEGGPESLTIDGLCLRAGKTKGSFYAHFQSHDEFITALALHWRKRYTDNVIERVETEAEPQHRMEHLNRIVIHLDARIGHGMRRLAEKNQKVEQMVAEIDQVRISYLADLHLASGNFTPEDARDLAIIENAAFIGLTATGYGKRPAEMERLYSTFVRLLTPRSPSERTPPSDLES